MFKAFNFELFQLNSLSLKFLILGNNVSQSKQIFKEYMLIYVTFDLLQTFSNKKYSPFSVVSFISIFLIRSFLQYIYLIWGRTNAGFEVIYRLLILACRAKSWIYCYYKRKKYSIKLRLIITTYVKLYRPKRNR